MLPVGLDLLRLQAQATDHQRGQPLQQLEISVGDSSAFSNRPRSRGSILFRRTTMRRLLCSLFLSLLGVIAAAQTAVVTRNVNLGPDASTDNDPIETLKPGVQLTLLAPLATAGYYHVKVPDGQAGFVWGRNVKIHADASTLVPTSGGAGESLRPLIAKGHPVDWWFAFKFNSASFPECSAGTTRACLFGGQVQSSWTSFSRQFVVASSDSKSLQPGTGCAGDTTDDPLGATFDEIYSGSLNYVVWNDQFYQDPKVAACGNNNSCSAPWGHSKGMIAWNDSGDGIVMQVTTPDWPGAGSMRHPRQQEGNTLGCTARDNDVLVSQHFFALKLTKDDVVKVLTALQNASVVTDTDNVQIVQDGGPADINALVAKLGVKSTSTTFTHDTLSTGVQLISKPSALHVPPWQMVSSVLGGVSLRAATWWASPQIPSTTSSTTIDCWDSSLSTPGAVEIATSGHFAGKTFGLKGIAAPDGNHAKIGVSTSGTHHYTIFGDMNQQGAISGTCKSSQNGRGGLFFVIDDADLSNSVKDLISGDSAPTGP